MKRLLSEMSDARKQEDIMSINKKQLESFIHPFKAMAKCMKIFDLLFEALARMDEKETKRNSQNFDAKAIFFFIVERGK